MNMKHYTSSSTCTEAATTGNMLMNLRILLLTVGFVYSTRVTEEENRRIQNICGTMEHQRRYKTFGGRVLENGEYRFAVTVDLKNNSTMARCTGSLISSRHVLTASHCVMDRPHRLINKMQCSLEKRSRKFIRYPYDVKRLSVNVVGKDGTSMTYAVKKVWSHEEWDDCDQRHDIAIVELEGADLTDITPICLPEENLSLSKFVKVIGMGLMPDGLGNATLTPTVVLFLNPSPSEPGTIEIKPSAKSTCEGDSGGPMIQLNNRRRYTVIGIVAGGTLNCGNLNALPEHDITNYHVDVRDNVRWICRITGVCPIGNVKNDRETFISKLRNLLSNFPNAIRKMLSMFDAKHWFSA